MPSTPNRLLHEKSPYLLQHAYNPVDWYPWGDEAFEKARSENKPILVSIGYSTCHWCHVMEHESYEDPNVAALMNQFLVNIKIDREERPDVDKIYMTAVSAMTGSGGWPLNVFLTPELKPFFGGTYFPPTARWGQPAWKDVVRQIGESWKNPEAHKKMMASSDQLVAALRQYTSVSTDPLQGDATWLDGGFKALHANYDATNGGFGNAPKFPMPVYFNFLLRYHARTHEPQALEMTLHTLREMAKGGIYDQLGGGFARYSTDARWHVPHFEKMLYDNAQLATNYLEAYQVTKAGDLARVARETLDYVRRDMTHAGGGFYSAEDADSLASADAHEKREGAFYVWERDEVLSLLGQPSGDIFCFRYGVRPEGNAAQDPHQEFKNKNILYAAHPLPETATHFKLTVEETSALLQAACQTLLAARSKRPRPHLDDKILSGWNGLMISAYAKGAVILNDPADLVSAQRAAHFLQAHLYDPSSRTLYRRWRDGQRLIEGTADDYAFVVQGLLDLYQADFDPQWLDWAIALTDSQVAQFYDADHGGFFMTSVAAGKHLLLRVKEDQDNVEPTASSVAALNLLRLAQYTDRADFQAMAEKTLRAFGSSMKNQPQALPQMLVALDYSLTEPRQIVIAGRPDVADTQALLKTLRRFFIPVETVMLVDGGDRQDALARRLDFVSSMHPVDGKAAAYVCVRHACQQPTTDPAVLAKLLSAL